MYQVGRTKTVFKGKSNSPARVRGEGGSRGIVQPTRSSCLSKPFQVQLLNNTTRLADRQFSNDMQKLHSICFLKCGLIKTDLNSCHRFTITVYTYTADQFNYKETDIKLTRQEVTLGYSVAQWLVRRVRFLPGTPPSAQQDELFTQTPEFIPSSG
jgi:hypothetical protein